MPDGRIRAKKNPLHRSSHLEEIHHSGFEGHSGQAHYGPQKQYEALLKKHAAEYNKLSKEFENWMAKEKEDEKLADAEKNPGIEKAEYDWMRLLPNLAKEMAKEVAGRAGGSNSVDQDKSNVGVGEMTEVGE